MAGRKLGTLEAVECQENKELVETATELKPENAAGLDERRLKMSLAIIQAIKDNGVDMEPEGYTEAAAVLEMLAEVFEKAVDISFGLFVPWPEMCGIAGLSPRIVDMLKSQALLAELLGPLHVDVVKQTKPKKGCSWPNFIRAVDID